jgi:uncharacterized protein
MEFMKLNSPNLSMLFLSIYCLFFVFLSFLVIKERFKARVAHGAGSDCNSKLAKMIRVHGNFAEYAPLFVLLLFGSEMLGMDRLYLKTFGILFFLSRLFHWKGILTTKTPNPYRAAGMMTTFGVIIVLSIWNIVVFLK